MVNLLRVVFTALLATAIRFSCIVNLPKDTLICPQNHQVTINTTAVTNHFTVFIIKPPVYIPAKSFIIPPPPPTLTIKFPYLPAPGATPLRRRQYDAEEEEYLFQLHKKRTSPPEKTATPSVVRYSSDIAFSRQTSTMIDAPTSCNTASYVGHSRDRRHGLKVTGLENRNPTILLLVAWLVTLSFVISCMFKDKTVTREPLPQHTEYQSDEDSTSTTESEYDYSFYQMARFKTSSLYTNFDHAQPCYTTVHKYHDVTYPSGKIQTVHVGVAILRDGIVFSWKPDIHYLPCWQIGHLRATWAMPNRDFTEFYIYQSASTMPDPLGDPPFASLKKSEEEMDKMERYVERILEERRLEKEAEIAAFWAQWKDEAEWEFDILCNMYEDAGETEFKILGKMGEGVLKWKPTYRMDEADYEFQLLGLMFMEDSYIEFRMLCDIYEEATLPDDEDDEDDEDTITECYLTTVILSAERIAEILEGAHYRRIFGGIFV